MILKIFNNVLRQSNTRSLCFTIWTLYELALIILSARDDYGYNGFSDFLYFVLQNAVVGKASYTTIFYLKLSGFIAIIT